MKNYISKRKNLWVFFDEERIFDEVAFLKSLPSNKVAGVVVRTKNKKTLYKKTKLISKIYRMKRYKLVVSSNPQIAMAVGIWANERYPQYELCLCNKESFERVKSEL